MNAFFKFVGTYQGFLVLEDVRLPEFIVSPAKEVELKPWMTQRAYPNRVQKKWIRRYGLIKKRCVHVFGDNIHVHPSTAKALLHELNDKGVLLNG